MVNAVVQDLGVCFPVINKPPIPLTLREQKALEIIKGLKKYKGGGERVVYQTPAQIRNHMAHGRLEYLGPHMEHAFAGMGSPVGVFYDGGYHVKVLKKNKN